MLSCAVLCMILYPDKCSCVTDVVVVQCMLLQRQCAGSHSSKGKASTEFKLCALASVQCVLVCDYLLVCNVLLVRDTLLVCSVSETSVA